MSHWADRPYKKPRFQTPWAEKFGETVFMPRDATGSVHSGFNTCWPEVRPEFICDWASFDKVPPEHYQTAKPPDDEEWDLILRSERYQLERFPGLKAWQLSGWLKSTGGYDGTGRGEYFGGKLKINEAAWPKGWTKKAWWETTEKIVEHPLFEPTWIPDIGPNETWSVDNPRVWKAIRPAIELATRLMHACCLSDVGRPL